MSCIAISHLQQPKKHGRKRQNRALEFSKTTVEILIDFQKITRHSARREPGNR